MTVADPTSAGTAEALAALGRDYWYPLYAFVRRLGQSPNDAQDLTQSFFERILEKTFIAQADRSIGRFRSFLLIATARLLIHPRKVSLGPTRSPIR